MGCDAQRGARGHDDLAACSALSQPGDLLYGARFQSSGRRLARRAGSEDRAEMTQARAGAGTKESVVRRWASVAVVGAFLPTVATFFALRRVHYLALDTIKQHRDALLAVAYAHH